MEHPFEWRLRVANLDDFDANCCKPILLNINAKNQERQLASTTTCNQLAVR